MSSVQAGGHLPEPSIFALKRFGMVKISLWLGGIHSLFQTKSYQLPSRGESVSTKAGGLMYMHNIFLMNEPCLNSRLPSQVSKNEINYDAGIVD